MLIPRWTRARGARAARAGATAALALFTAGCHEGVSGPPFVAVRSVAHRAPHGLHDAVLRDQTRRTGGHLSAPTDLVRQAVGLP